MVVIPGYDTDIEDIFIAGDRRFEIEVVGASDHQGYLAFLSRSKSKLVSEGEFIAKLHYENGNPNDCNAIRVVVSGGTVGYLSQEDSRRFRERINQLGMDGIIVSCNAIIGGGKRIGFFRKSDLDLHLDLPITKL